MRNLSDNGITGDKFSRAGPRRRDDVWDKGRAGKLDLIGTQGICRGLTNVGGGGEDTFWRRPGGKLLVVPKPAAWVGMGGARRWRDVNGGGVLG